MNRRVILMVLGILWVAMLSGACGKKEPTLSLLVWEGYADPSFVRPFEDSHHCKIAASYRPVVGAVHTVLEPCTYQTFRVNHVAARRRL